MPLREAIATVRTLREAERHLARLRRDAGGAPIALAEQPAATIDVERLRAMGETLAPLWESGDGA